MYFFLCTKLFSSRPSLFLPPSFHAHSSSVITYISDAGRTMTISPSCWDPTWQKKLGSQELLTTGHMEAQMHLHSHTLRVYPSMLLFREADCQAAAAYWHACSCMWASAARVMGCSRAEPTLKLHEAQSFIFFWHKALVGGSNKWCFLSPFSSFGCWKQTKSWMNCLTSSQ